MKIRKPSHLMVIAAGSLLLGACAPRLIPTSTQEANDAQIAKETLLRFLSDLHEGGYEEAAALYGGTYDTMIGHNESVSPADHVSLMRNACEINGAQCLEVENAKLNNQPAPGQFTFSLRFRQQDGTIYSRGPCCGASESDEPPQSTFLLTVKKTPDGSFLVMDMPPYSP
jgi:hypothetical protein